MVKPVSVCDVQRYAAKLINEWTGPVVTVQHILRKSITKQFARSPVHLHSNASINLATAKRKMEFFAKYYFAASIAKRQRGKDFRSHFSFTGAPTISPTNSSANTTTELPAFRSADGAAN